MLDHDWNGYLWRLRLMYCRVLELAFKLGEPS